MQACDVVAASAKGNRPARAAASNTAPCTSRMMSPAAKNTGERAAAESVTRAPRDATRINNRKFPAFSVPAETPRPARERSPATISAPVVLNNTAQAAGVRAPPKGGRCGDISTAATAPKAPKINAVDAATGGPDVAGTAVKLRSQSVEAPVQASKRSCPVTHAIKSDIHE